MNGDRGTTGHGASGGLAAAGDAATMMDPSLRARLRARECHADAVARTCGERSAPALVAAAAGARDIEVVEIVPGTRSAPGMDGFYDRAGPLVSVAPGLGSGEREFVIARGIGHHELHDDDVAELTIAGAVPRGGPAAPALGCRLTRADRAIAAGAFADEFLCPADWLRTRLLDGRRHGEVARELGLPARVVARQALRALLLPPQRAPGVRCRPEVELDGVQREAAAWEAGPLFVEAGPGTGKTATLVGRIRHLLGAGVPGGAILVLTFSRAAAAEVRGRVAVAAPDAVDALWIGTFHSLGLDVLRTFHARAGLPADPIVLDRDGGLALLERRLADLPLRHHRDLHDPAVGLSPVLRAIERCKDDMVTPEQYAEAAREAALDGDGGSVEAVLEVAAVYRAYQDGLAAEGALDLGDLVMRATALLEGNDDVAAGYGGRFRHVLVDEYQDVNPAAARMLASLCGPGTTPWVVGDGRQSIHRFRGAQRDAAAAFVDAFGGTLLTLQRNFRSRSEVIRAFATFSATMRGGAGAWTCHRGAGGGVRVASAPSLAGEAVAIRDRIAELRDAGVGHADQAVIARTHSALDRIGSELERLGVPLLHLGDPFARPEVRDLLALLAVAAGELVALVRAAALPPFGVSRRDAAAAVVWGASRRLGVRAVLRRAGEVPGMATASVDGLARLGEFLDRRGNRATAWSILVAFLLDEREWLRAILADARGDMRLVAVHGLVGLALAEAGDAGRLLARVRRIVALGEGRDHGTVPPEGDDGDSVRLTTIHAAKGLEYVAVHVPMATARHLPSPRRPDRCPPPPDLARLSMSSADHEAEERALAFVALSRARDHLTLSHARSYGGHEVRSSPYLARIGPVDATRHEDPPRDRVGDRRRDDRMGRPLPSRHEERHLRTYARCPARHRYDVVDGLAVAVAPSAHRRTRLAIAAAIERLEDATATSGQAPGAEVDAAFADAWAAHGPIHHRLNDFHRGIARRAVGNLATIIAGELGASRHRETWEVEVGHGVVKVRPDRVVEHPWGTVVVQRIDLFRPGASWTPSAHHGLLHLGARARFPEQRIVVEHLDAEAGEGHHIDVVDPEELVTPYADAMDGIVAGRFPARPGPACARCPYDVVCGA